MLFEPAFFLSFFPFKLNFNDKELACTQRHKRLGLLLLLPDKGPQHLDKKAISLCNRTIQTQTRDQRSHSPWSLGG